MKLRNEVTANHGAGGGISSEFNGASDDWPRMDERPMV